MTLVNLKNTLKLKHRMDNSVISPHNTKHYLPTRSSLKGTLFQTTCNYFTSHTVNQLTTMKPSYYSQSKSKLSTHPFQDSQYPSSQIKKKKNQVFLEGYVDEEELVRAKSLTDEDLEELKGCLDLGFGFSYDEIPELCNTLPALELCYSMSRKFVDDQQKSNVSGKASWKISSPGDDPKDVKARLKFWAQAVACTVKLCS